ncbi:MAG: hypothetical protein KC572_11370 [Gammaproteobacteria bacterium]|jgi:hypothetical protein|nr:hypothetical protein [Gammaproteobacteria bacterium]
MAKLRTMTLIALLFAAMGTASADTLKMDGASAMSDDGRPSRGMTQARVEAKYGSPASVRAPVGDPPITRWEYTNFVVFFEHDKVIHAVLKR